MGPPPTIDAACASAGSPARSPGAPQVEVIVARWSAIWPFLVASTVCTIAGGLVAAISRPMDFGHGPWLAAYLVLVGGVAQVGLGAGQALLADVVPNRGIVRIETAAWNAGLLGVVAGTLVPSPFLTTIGSAATALALALLVRSTRARGRSVPWARGIFLVLVVTILVSMPIGVVLAWARHA